MADVREVKKEDRNTGLNFNFRGIDAVVNAVGPALRTHSVIVLPKVQDYTATPVTTANGKSSIHVIVKVEYTFVGPAGDSLSAVVIGEAMDYGDKAVAKAMSVAFRIALLQALTLPTDDPDPDSQNYERAASAPVTSQSGLWEIFMSRVEAAAELDVLRLVWQEMSEAGKQGMLSQNDVEEINDAIKDRKQAIELGAGVQQSTESLHD
jgi:hypothetical protein